MQKSMVTLDDLPSITRRRKKRVGRGYGSGKGGHTVGRGTKGQKSRGKIGPLFEGTKTKKSLVQRLPLLRGKGKLKTRKKKPFLVTLGQLDSFSAGRQIDVETLIKSGLVPDLAARVGVRVLGSGTLKKRLTVALQTSKRAAAKIQAVGGEIK